MLTRLSVCGTVSMTTTCTTALHEISGCRRLTAVYRATNKHVFLLAVPFYVFDEVFPLLQNERFNVVGLHTVAGSIQLTALSGLVSAMKMGCSYKSVCVCVSMFVCVCVSGRGRVLQHLRARRESVSLCPAHIYV